ncbi:hypothetical protein DPMN_068771 [Dreissena polymorpha]|uniref:Uncharacterized protein n=1 Tax=Dreissena polymorpha TaxID=45954 RepID=A0A9D4BUF9_DREPO|nr:hypothetical protein DPMN_068771 [Dreissena polymorpha]
MFYDSIIACGNISNPSNVKLLCVTISEKQSDESIQNQTKDTIQSHISTAIEYINDMTVRDYFENKLKSIPGRKQDLIVLYQEILCGDNDDVDDEVDDDVDDETTQ